MFDYKRILNNCRINYVPGFGNVICIRDKEEFNLYNMFHVRQTLHRTAYQHRVVQCIDSMFIDAFLKADKHLLIKGENG